MEKVEIIEYGKLCHEVKIENSVIQLSIIDMLY